jgi:hypothetical protein
MNPKILGLTAVALLTGPFVANATPVTWDVNATLSSGGSVTGTFVFDADLGALGTYLAVNLTANSTVIGNSTFTVADVFVNDATASQLFFNDVPSSFGSSNGLALSWGPAITDAGGTSLLFGDGYSGLCPGPFCADDAITGGTIVSVTSAVPVPGTLPLLVSCLAGLGFMRRRKVS